MERRDSVMRGAVRQRGNTGPVRASEPIDLSAPLLGDTSFEEAPKGKSRRILWAVLAVVILGGVGTVATSALLGASAAGPVLLLSSQSNGGSGGFGPEHSGAFIAVVAVLLFCGSAVVFGLALLALAALRRHRSPATKHLFPFYPSLGEKLVLAGVGLALLALCVAVPVALAMRRVELGPPASPAAAANRAASTAYALTTRWTKNGGSYEIWAKNTYPMHQTLRLELRRPSTASPGYSTHVLPPGKDTLVKSFPSNLSFKYNWKSKWGKASNAHSNPRYLYPFNPASKRRCTQAAGGSFTHNKRSNKFAVDLSMPEGTPVRAARGGVVLEARGTDCCQDMSGKTGNYVTILHSDETLGYYAHFVQHGVLVQVGDTVKAGQVIGKSGNTGYSTGPHLHFHVQRLNGDVGGPGAPGVNTRFGAKGCFLKKDTLYPTGACPAIIGGGTATTTSTSATGTSTTTKKKKPKKKKKKKKKKNKKKKKKK